MLLNNWYCFFCCNKFDSVTCIIKIKASALLTKFINKIICHTYSMIWRRDGYVQTSYYCIMIICHNMKTCASVLHSSYSWFHPSMSASSILPHDAALFMLLTHAGLMSLSLRRLRMKVRQLLLIMLLIRGFHIPPRFLLSYLSFIGYMLYSSVTFISEHNV